MLSLDLCLGLQRADHHDHVAAVNHRSRLDATEFGHVLREALEETHTLLGTRLLATAEQDHCFDLVAALQEALGTLALGLVVVHVDLQSKTHFFEDGVGLVALGFFRLLRGFVLELAEIHNLGDGRLGIGSNLNQIQVCLLGKTNGVFNAHYTDLLAVGANKSDLRHADSVIGTGIADA